jgi:hypothetical protein
MPKRRALSYEEHLHLGELLWMADELAKELYDVARKRCRKAELRPLERLFATLSVFDLIKSRMDDALSEDASAWIPRPDTHTLGKVYYSVSERIGTYHHQFQYIDYKRRVPLTLGEYERLDTLLCALEAQASEAWELAAQRCSVPDLKALERVWRSSGTLSKLARLFERKLWEDAHIQRTFGPGSL